MSLTDTRQLGAELIESANPAKRVLGTLIAAYSVAHELHQPPEVVPGVIFMPDGEGSIGACALTSDPAEGLHIALHGVCALAIGSMGLDLATTQRLLSEAWGEEEARGMGGVGRHAAAPRTRRPATRRGRGKRGR